ncbi:MAG: DUF3303 domain-containing protein [Longimicrobiales bacterium]
MKFMVIEHFKNRDPAPVYARLAERGRMLPDGVQYLGSWVEPNYDRCFQLMEAPDQSALERWAQNWSDLVSFEFVPVLDSATAARSSGEPVS